MLIIDAVGYFPFANIFFQVVSKKYEHGERILTSNKSFMDWVKVFGDDVLATAILITPSFLILKENLIA
ncbi:ATP-binding protein [Peribacillus frigoritolerans]|uniref:ATP-binding protein n=1 Tax=Peribacillus frigoritolerans TaxID=450367 RepID=UPI002E1BF618|nr:ATP-binding protein [Peribacillus frigoritolerans]MED4690415.1 ATP-binding protein [Peribacillus frigoritolerans]